MIPWQSANPRHSLVLRDSAALQICEPSGKKNYLARSQTNSKRHITNGIMDQRRLEVQYSVYILDKDCSTGGLFGKVYNYVHAAAVIYMFEPLYYRSHIAV